MANNELGFQLQKFKVLASSLRIKPAYAPGGNATYAWNFALHKSGEARRQVIQNYDVFWSPYLIKAYMVDRKRQFVTGAAAAAAAAPIQSNRRAFATHKHAQTRSERIMNARRRRHHANNMAPWHQHTLIVLNCEPGARDETRPVLKCLVRRVSVCALWLGCVRYY